MSNKSTTFIPTYLKRAAAPAQQRKTGSWAPPPVQVPYNADAALRAAASVEATTPAATPFQARMDERRETEMGLRLESGDVLLPVNLTEAVALVSAVLQAADHSLVQAARWETGGYNDKAKQFWARSVMLEQLAERIAKLSRQETKQH